jgi:hypothetical protein
MRPDNVLAIIQDCVDTSPMKHRKHYDDAQAQKGVLLIDYLGFIRPKN